MSTSDYAKWRQLAPAVLSKLQSAALDPAAWPAALNTISEAFRCTAFVLRTIGENTPPSSIFSDQGEMITDAYIRGEWWNRDPRAVAFMTAPPLTIVEDSDLLTDNEIARSDFYRDFAFRHGASHLAAWRFTDGDINFAFACNRSAAVGPVSTDEKRALNELMSQATAAAILARNISNARNQIVFEALVNARAAACLLDARGRVLSVTPELETLLGNATWKKNASISFVETKPTGAFDALLTALTSPPDDITGAGSFVAIFPGKPRLIALPLILRGAGADVVGGAKALIIFRSIDAAVTFNPDLLMETFGLTSSEASVAIMIAQGKTVAETSEVRGVTVDTIRAMLKSTFHKTGTRSQAELVALLLRSTIAIAN